MLDLGTIVAIISMAPFAGVLAALAGFGGSVVLLPVHIRRAGDRANAQRPVRCPPEDDGLLVRMDALFAQLERTHGKGRVGTENPSGVGTRIDAVVHWGDGRCRFYEIKTSSSARACLREAIGQLLEYVFWPGAQQAERLVIIGEPPLDEQARRYLELLTTEFRLPLHYEQIDAS